MCTSKKRRLSRHLCVMCYDHDGAHKSRVESWISYNLNNHLTHHPLEPLYRIAYRVASATRVSPTYRQADEKGERGKRNKSGKREKKGVQCSAIPSGSSGGALSFLEFLVLASSSCYVLNAFSFPPFAPDNHTCVPMASHLPP